MQGTCSPPSGGSPSACLPPRSLPRPAPARAPPAPRPGAGGRPVGSQRSEARAALAKGLLLVGVSVGIAIAAAGRFGDPPGIDGGGVLALGLFGLAGNVAATAVLAGGGRQEPHLEGVLRHSVADALGSIGVGGRGAALP